MAVGCIESGTCLQGKEDSCRLLSGEIAVNILVLVVNGVYETPDTKRRYRSTAPSPAPRLFELRLTEDYKYKRVV